MTETTIEAHFQRWRELRHADDLAVVFDRTAPALMRLARHLAPRGIEADDLLQATFLTALESSDRWDSTRPLAPWLAGILGRRALAERRRLGRVPDAERVNSPASDDPAAATANQEAADLLASAIQRVPETYRGVLEGRLIQGEPARDVAARLGRQPSTVHVQFHRGLELLRRALPAGLGAGAYGSSGLDARLDRVRSRVLRAATGDAAGLVAASAALLPIAAGIAAVALVATVAAWAFLRETPRDVDPVDREAGVAEVGSEEDVAALAIGLPSRALAAGGVESSPDGPPAQEVAQESDTEGDDTEGGSPVRWWVVGRVLAPAGVDHGRSALQGTKIRMDGPGVGMEFGVVRADGQFRAPMLSPPPWEAAVDIGGASPEPRPTPEIIFVVTHPDYLPTRRAVPFDERIGDTVSVELELRAAGRVRGRAMDDAGDDLSICFSQVYPLVRGALGSPAIADRGFRAPSSYDLRSAPGPSVAVVGIGGKRPAGTEILVLEATTHDLETLVLEGGATLSGVVLAPFRAGTNVEARLEAAGSSQPLGPLEVTWHRGRAEWAMARASVGADGHFQFEGLAPGERYRVSIGERSATTTAGGGPIEL